MKIPKKYSNRLSRKDKKRQLRSIRNARRSYRKGVYVDRPKLKSYHSKKSSWVTKFEKKYGDNVKTYKEIEKATGIPKKALMAVVKKGKGAYYSSGSRPNQTAQSWGRARLASAITGGKSAAVDFHIIEKECKRDRKAYIEAMKAKKKHGKGTRRVKSVKI